MLRRVFAERPTCLRDRAVQRVPNVRREVQRRLHLRDDASLYGPRLGPLAPADPQVVVLPRAQRRVVFFCQHRAVTLPTRLPAVLLPKQRRKREPERARTDVAAEVLANDALADRG